MIVHVCAKCAHIWNTQSGEAAGSCPNCGGVAAAMEPSPLQKYIMPVPESKHGISEAATRGLVKAPPGLYNLDKDGNLCLP